MRKTKKLSKKEARELAYSLSQLPFNWEKFLKVGSNEWYELKYKIKIERFLNDRRPALNISDYPQSFFTKQIKIQESNYSEWMELSEINVHLEKLILNPPLGIANENNSGINKKQLDIIKKYQDVTK